jgi:hypothetical protein
MLQIMKHPGRGSHSDGAANRPEDREEDALGTEHGQTMMRWVPGA